MSDSLRPGRRSALRAIAAACAAAAGMPRLAQAQETQPLTIVVPFNAGSGPDAMARFIGEKLRARLRRPVLVENRAGASGNIGTQRVAAARPDGNTLLLTANTLVMNVSLFKDLKYDPITSFAPIAKVAMGRLALVVNAALPIHNASEFASFAKANASTFTYASPGAGTPQHLAMELLLKQQGISVTHIPYSGLSQAMTDLIGGHVGAMFIGLHLALPLVKTDKLRIVAIGSPSRSPAAPRIQTLEEQGVPGVDADAWYGLYAPAGVPAELLAHFREATDEVLRSPELIEFMTKQGLEPGSGTIDQFTQVMKVDRVKWAEIIRDNRIVVE